MTTLPDWLAIVTVLGSLAAAVLATWKVALPAYRVVRRVTIRAGRALDVVLGTPEVLDPDRPGEVLKLAVPDIGVRVTSIQDKLDVAVLHHVERAEAAAEKSATAAEAASRDAAAALEGVSQLRAEVSQWQGVDKVKADFADAMVTEMGKTDRAIHQHEARAAHQADNA